MRKGMAIGFIGILLIVVISFAVVASYVGKSPFQIAKVFAPLGWWNLGFLGEATPYIDDSNNWLKKYWHYSGLDCDPEPEESEGYNPVAKGTTCYGMHHNPFGGDHRGLMSKVDASGISWKTIWGNNGGDRTVEVMSNSEGEQVLPKPRTGVSCTQNYCYVIFEDGKVGLSEDGRLVLRKVAKETGQVFDYDGNNPPMQDNYLPALRCYESGTCYYLSHDDSKTYFWRIRPVADGRANEPESQFICNGAPTGFDCDNQDAAGYCQIICGNTLYSANKEILTEVSPKYTMPATDLSCTEKNCYSIYSEKTNGVNGRRIHLYKYDKQNAILYDNVLCDVNIPGTPTGNCKLGGTGGFNLVDDANQGWAQGRYSAENPPILFALAYLFDFNPILRCETLKNGKDVCHIAGKSHVNLYFTRTFDYDIILVVSEDGFLTYDQVGRCRYNWIVLGLATCEGYEGYKLDLKNFELGRERDGNGVYYLTYNQHLLTRKKAFGA